MWVGNVWRKIRHSVNPPLYAGMVVVLAFSIVAWRQASNATRAVDKKFCAIAVPSWEIRNKLIHEINEPSTLAKGIDPNSAEGKALQAQVDKNNKRKAERLANDLKTNGKKPC